MFFIDLININRERGATFQKTNGDASKQTQCHIHAYAYAHVDLKFMTFSTSVEQRTMNKCKQTKRFSQIGTVFCVQITNFLRTKSI